MGGWASKPPAAGFRGRNYPRGTGAEENKAPVHGVGESRWSYRFDGPGDPGTAAEREPPQVPRCELNGAERKLHQTRAGVKRENRGISERRPAATIKRVESHDFLGPRRS